MHNVKSKVIILFAVCAAVIFLLSTVEHDRKPPENLNVFVLNDQTTMPKEFYSSPHAYQLMQRGVPMAKMSLARARSMGIPMAKDSRQDFSCFHSVVAWWLIDHDMWPNYCRWNSKGEWQDIQ